MTVSHKSLRKPNMLRSPLYPKLEGTHPVGWLHPTVALCYKAVFTVVFMVREFSVCIFIVRYFHFCIVMKLLLMQLCTEPSVFHCKIIFIVVAYFMELVAMLIYLSSVSGTAFMVMAKTLNVQYNPYSVESIVMPAKQAV